MVHWLWEETHDVEVVSSNPLDRLRVGSANKELGSNPDLMPLGYQ